MKTFSYKLIRLTFLGVLLLLFFSCVPIEKKQSPLLGTWHLKEVQWISKDTTHFLKMPQPGLLLVTPDAYSIMWSPKAEKRTPFKILSNPTEAEIKYGFSSIIFNSGSYESTDSTMTTKATIAKVPGFEKGQQYYRYSIKENKLLLTMYDEVYPDGSKPQWSGLWETKFVFNKGTGNP